MFHLKNKGILFSIDEITYNEENEELNLTFSNNKLHGVIDGGHTLKIILNNYMKKDILNNQWVLVEILENINNVKKWFKYLHLEIFLFQLI